MFTPDTLKQAELTNKFFEKNLFRNESTLIDRLGKADFVPMDFRFLTDKNQQLFTDVIQRLPKEQQSQIIIFR